MKFKIDKNEIINVLAGIQGLTGRKSNLAITACVLIEAQGSQIKASATDLETGLEGNYPADVFTEGKIAVSAKKLYEIVKDFPSESISINEIDNFWIEISDTHLEFHLVGLNPEDFPPFPTFENVSLFSVDAEKLKRMIDQNIVITAVGDEKRAHIIGSYFEIVKEEKSVRMVSTDGNRLSAAECLIEGDLPENSAYIIPKKGLVELNKFLSSEETVRIGFKENYCIVQKENETIMIRLLEGDFPKYKEILKPRGQGHIIKLDKQNFAMMLKRMSILSTDDFKGVIFSFFEDRLQIRSTNPEIGQSKEEMNMDYNGPEINVAFNPRYFMDALNNITDETIELHMMSDEKPCFIEGENDKTFVTVIMPMRI